MIEYRTYHDPEEITNIPLKATILKHTLTDKYTIEFQKYGNKYKGFTVDLLPEQVKRLKWWY
jgi:hypothetical protein